MLSWHVRFLLALSKAPKHVVPFIRVSLTACLSLHEASPLAEGAIAINPCSSLQ